MLTCTCGFRGYAGYLREYEYLTQRRQWLADRIAEQARRRTSHRAGLRHLAGRGHNRRSHPREGSAQTLLVTLGAGLLILAGLVFVAVAWELFGPFGQLAILAGSALVTDSPPSGCARVPRTAEALAVVAFALGLIVAGAGPGLGALPEGGDIDSPTPGCLLGGGRVRPPGGSPLRDHVVVVAGLAEHAGAAGQCHGNGHRPSGIRTHHHAVRHRVPGAGFGLVAFPQNRPAARAGDRIAESDRRRRPDGVPARLRPPTGAVVVVSVALLAVRCCCRTSWGTAPRPGSAGRCSASGWPCSRCWRRPPPR